jgi:hypothetical protein
MFILEGFILKSWLISLNIFGWSLSNKCSYFPLTLIALLAHSKNKSYKVCI